MYLIKNQQDHTEQISKDDQLTAALKEIHRLNDHIDKIKAFSEYNDGRDVITILPDEEKLDWIRNELLVYDEFKFYEFKETCHSFQIEISDNTGGYIVKAPGKVYDRSPVLHCGPGYGILRTRLNARGIHIKPSAITNPYNKPVFDGDVMTDVVINLETIDSDIIS